ATGSNKYGGTSGGTIDETPIEKWRSILAVVHLLPMIASLRLSPWARAGTALTESPPQTWQASSAFKIG
ncbi:MAG: hypothetical protein NTW89_04835, partial [Burkholderiales bacterium]|nr:hypothetical protein [Burkholderiales bacterium]